MKKNIDIILSVIDNYGDMGFAGELLLGLEHVYPGGFHYTLWTDSIDATNAFLEISRASLPEYSLKMLEHFGEHERSTLCFSLFHGFIPDMRYFEIPSLVLRIDYLSLDREWVKHHGGEHIGSNSERRIIEIIPSPLPAGGGIFRCTLGDISKDELASLYHLDPSKKWITLFVYPDTLRDTLSLHAIPEGHEVVILGASEDPSLGRDDPSIHVLPFLPLEHFHHILALSEWSIVRGEMSFMNMLALEKPFFWDMYKSIGGLPESQSRQFLELSAASPKYRDIHSRINKKGPGKISLHECQQVLTSGGGNMRLKKTKPADLIHEVKKFIDSFYFSL